ncbi:MAG TPA: aminodeoxychorismate lyase [Xanthomonadaceae bacterium]|nr:aminodeoxychorismate lyase [Xanthomonadaceae bacterium]
MSARIFAGDRRIDAVPVDDRGLAYGDGLFETLRVHRGVAPWWDAHWSRLAQGARRLGIPLPDPARVRAESDALFGDGGDGVLKLQLTRGSGGRGYAPPARPVPTWIVSRHPLPAASAGLRLRWCETRLAVQPALAGIKHCNRLEQVLARRECEDAGVDDGVLCDGDGAVVAATAANLFVLRDGGWLTPPVDRCGVAGVCRAHLLPVLQAREARLSPAGVEGADALFLCNAVRGILVVDRLGARAFDPHPAVEGARRALARLHPAFAMETP